MLGHVSQSVGAALPGATGGLSALVSQALVTTAGTSSITVPDGASHAFVEVLAKGGTSSASASVVFTAGGAGTDAIWPVAAGTSISFTLGYSDSPSSAQASSSTYSGATITANSPATDQTAAVAGKYPSGDGTTSAGLGGGRLAAAGGGTNYNDPSNSPGYGRGRRNPATGSPALAGGRPVGCVTFFRSAEAALAFANSLYGGNWQP